MERIREIYDSLWNKSIEKFGTGEFELDPVLDLREQDHRRGITLIGRPDNHVADNLLGFLKECRVLEPYQHYYDRTDLHMTVLSIISCYQGFELENYDLNAYCRLIRNATLDSGPFRISYHGITASPSCIMVQGFPADDRLQLLRKRLRDAFRNTQLESSIDQRYTLETAHSTIIRFKKPVTDKDRLLDCLRRYREFDFGSSEYKEISLVYNDWYMTNSIVRNIMSFEL